MKLGLVRRGYSATGGAEAYLQRFAAALSAQGHEPFLFTSDDWPSAQWPHGIHRLQGGSSPVEFARLLQAAHPEKECDLVFSLERVFQCDAYRAGDGVHAAWLDRRGAYEASWRGWFRRISAKHRALCALERSLYTGGTRLVVANSRMVRQEIVDRFSFPAERIPVIYNGVPAAADEEMRFKWRGEMRRQLGLGDRDYLVLFAGSGWERKGLRFAITAVERAASDGVRLLAAGSGSRRALPRSERTVFLGPQAGLGKALAAADVFILPTIYDPFSNACLEALAYGLPVITTRANGFAEIMQDSEGSVVDQASDVNALAAAVEYWSNPTRRSASLSTRLAKAGLYSVEKNLRETLAALQQLKESR